MVGRVSASVTRHRRSIWRLLQIAAAQKAPHPAFGHPLPEGEGTQNPSPYGRRCPEGADEGVCHGVQEPTLDSSA